MSEPINNPDYWKARLRKAIQSDSLHHAVFKCPAERWARIEQSHRIILGRLIMPGESVIDCGCGYGRLLTLMPADWYGTYLGIDLSPDFIEMAKEIHPLRKFWAGTLESTLPIATESTNPEDKFDWAVFVSVRPMIRRELGDQAWYAIETLAKAAAKKLLFLEYDCQDPGEVVG